MFFKNKYGFFSFRKLDNFKMRIFHIVEEVSKKNNSIVSITKTLLRYKINKESKIIIPHSEVKIKGNNKEIKKVEIFRNLFKFNSTIYEFLNNNKPDVIHIHGLWRPIHLLFIISAKQLNIPIIIQPHGMLLDEAIKTKSKVTYFLKLIIIFIYKFLLKNEIFIAVTSEEKKSIFKYFKTKNIYVIPNPFDSTYKVTKNVKNNISFFGRFSQHKNIDLIVESFLAADLNSKWKLLIYGIDDDQNYKEKIKKIINNSDSSNRILIKNPIFDKNKKFKKMSENYLNILMSKSEILSLSVLEGLSVGTKSLVNKEIKYPKKISNLLYFTEPKKNKIADKMKKIVNNYSNNFIERNKIKEKFKKVYNLTISKDKYENLLNRIIKLKNYKLNINILNISIANALNSFLVAFLVVIYGLINPKISAEIGIIEGTILFLLQVFSSNSRAILLNEKNDKYFNDFISFRLLVSFTIFLLFYFFFKNIAFIEEDFHLILIFLILISWVNEITLVLIEKKKLKFTIKIFISFSLLFYLLLSASIIFDIFKLNLIIAFFIVFNLIIFNYFFDLRQIIDLKYKINFLYQNLFPFLSTLSNTVSVLFWRYSILFFTTKETAGIIFAIFSIASFPGTFYNNILGQTILRQKVLKDFFNKYEKIFYTVSISLILIAYFFSKNNKLYQIDTFILNILTLSFLGTIIMLISLRKRNRSLYKLFKYKNMIFKRDILYSFSIFPMIILLFFINGTNGLIYAYFLSAVLSFIFYSMSYGYNYK